MRPTTCSYCRVDTAGNHEKGCPCGSDYRAVPEMRGTEQIGVTFERKDAAQDVLLEAAECLDDCLVRIYPEEFSDESIKAANVRFSKGRGTIARIATIVDKLKKMVTDSTAQDVMGVLPLDIPAVAHSL